LPAFVRSGEISCFKQSNCWVNARTVAYLALLVVVACIEPDTRHESANITILPGGARAVTHTGVEFPPQSKLVQEVLIGAVDGLDEYTFGEIRAVVVDASERIHVLDFQTQLIRTFSPTGQFLRTTARRGGGPAEVEDANGMMVDASGTLWVNDPGNGRLIAIDSTGVQLASYLRKVTEYRYVWSGGADSTGWIWDMVSHFPPDAVRPSPGVHEFVRKIFGKGFDTRETARVDSLLLANVTSKSITMPSGNAQVPFYPRTLVEFDLAGGFWITHGITYEVIHIDVAGDTTLMITNRAEPVPVTDEQRAGAIERLEDWQRRAGPANIDYSVIPAFHPAVIQIIPERSGGVWVRRPTTDGSFVADRYSSDGAYKGTVSSSMSVSQHHRTVVRKDVVHMVTSDSFGVQYVVKARSVPLTSELPGQ